MPSQTKTKTKPRGQNGTPEYAAPRRPKQASQWAMIDAKLDDLQERIRQLSASADELLERMP